MFLQYLFDPFYHSHRIYVFHQFCDNLSVSCNLRPKFRSGLTSERKKHGEECPATCFGEVVFVLSLCGPGAGGGRTMEWPTKMEK